jgi:hypothetical protein
VVGGRKLRRKMGMPVKDSWRHHHTTGHWLNFAIRHEIKFGAGDFESQMGMPVSNIWPSAPATGVCHDIQRRELKSWDFQFAGSP